MNFIPTNDMKKIIDKNFNMKMFNVAKFYGWLENNDVTPIEIKLCVLYNCMFSALLYGSETWGAFSCVHDKLRKMGKKALKAIIKVKSGTTNDLVYHESCREDIISRIKDCQHKFFMKVSQLPQEDAIVQSILAICKNNDIITYYSSLHN